eukprot:6204865-Pyramimonas_sp.AAC.1
MPPRCVAYVAALEPPDFIVVHEMVQAYSAFVEVAVADDGWCCRWPETRLALKNLSLIHI